MSTTNFTLKVVTTSAIVSRMRESPEFKLIVDLSVSRFLGNDWGISGDKAINDSNYLDALGVYIAPCADGKIWIKSDDYREYDGSRLVTVLFPSEY